MKCQPMALIYTNTQYFNLYRVRVEEGGEGKKVVTPHPNINEVNVVFFLPIYIMRT